MFCIFDGQIGTTLNSADSQAQVSLNSRGVNDTLLQALHLARGLIIHVWSAQISLRLESMMLTTCVLMRFELRPANYEGTVTSSRSCT